MTRIKGAMVAGQEGLLSIEIFAAKGPDGRADGDVFMAVPCRSGLRDADALRIDGRSMVALQQKSIMPIDFPPLTEKVRSHLVRWSESGKPLPIAEFMARGLFDAYFVKLVVVA